MVVADPCDERIERDGQNGVGACRCGFLHWHTLYAHAQKLQVKVGDVVQKGQQIGLIGDTGNTTGPHLHFEVRINKADGSVSRVNPLNYVSKP